MPRLTVGACAVALAIALSIPAAAQDATVPPTEAPVTAAAGTPGPTAVPGAGTVVPIDLEASPTTEAGSSAAADEPADRRIRRIVLTLTGVGLLMVLVTVLYWRATKPVEPLLANLATIDSRRFHRATPEERAAMLHPHPAPADEPATPGPVLVDLPPAVPLPPLVEPEEVPAPPEDDDAAPQAGTGAPAPVGADPEGDDGPDDTPAPAPMVGGEPPAEAEEVAETADPIVVALDAPVVTAGTADPGGAPATPSGSVSSDG